MTVFVKRMPAGIPGAITRPWASIIDPIQITGPAAASNAPQGYGVGVVIDATTGKARLPVVTDKLINGFLTRPYPGGAAEFKGVLGITPIDYDHVGDLMRSGFLSVLLGGATAAVKQGRVFVRKANAVTGKPIGGVEAAADLGTTAGVVTGTGNGTWTPDPTAPVSAAGIEGAYKITFTSGTAYTVTDPNGDVVGTGTITATTGQTSVFNGQIKGTITEGSVVFIATDVITVTVAFNTIQLGDKSFFEGAAYTDSTYGAMTEIGFNI
jgi:hypothetical protein